MYYGILLYRYVEELEREREIEKKRKRDEKKKQTTTTTLNNNIIIQYMTIENDLYEKKLCYG